MTMAMFLVRFFRYILGSEFKFSVTKRLMNVKVIKNFFADATMLF